MTCTHCVGKADRPIDVGEPHPHQPHDCTATINQLFDIAIRSSQAFTTAALACCATPKGCGCKSTSATGPSDGSRAATVKRTVHSKEIATQRIPKDRQITLETPLTNGYLEIPHDRITLQPSGGRDPQLRPIGALKQNQVTFHIDVDATGIPGAVYFGTVRVGALDGSSEEMVRVTIEL